MHAKEEHTEIFCVVLSYFNLVLSYSSVCVLQEHWGHVEEIELMNDGSGLGFGIVGGKAAGVVVRTLVQNSIADKVCFYVLHPHLRTTNPHAQLFFFC